jgi:outer membrane protein assembly factor BamB
MKALALIVALAACGPKHVFQLSSDENNPYALKQALDARRLPAQPTPVNDAKSPRVFAVTAGSPKTIVAYDLASGNAMWKADADVQSKIAVGGDFIVALEGTQLVARDQARGSVRWKKAVSGKFIGLAADAKRAYLVSGHVLVGYDGATGNQIWTADASGELGAPGAHGGIVYVPYLRQWLSLIDGATGKQLTRIRGLDEQIAMLDVTSTRAYYGSKQGVFVLDEQSANGKRSDASYARAHIPGQLEGTTYGTDVYDPVQMMYTAAERKRVLWTQLPTAGYAIHYFRYVLGFGPAGEMTWAYSNPRVELVASDHTGGAIVAVASNGDVVALDPKDGTVRAKKSLGTTQPVLGATFDADGWAPTGEAEKSDPVAVLTSIALDREARFDRVKELAVRRLAQMPGPQVTQHLLAVIADPRQPQKLKDTVVELLMDRKDASSLPVLTKQLEVRTDFIAGTQPESLAAVAKGIAGLATTKLDPKHVEDALVALQAHLESPATSSGELAQIIAAMTAIGGGAERTALTSHLLLYHADDNLGDDGTWQRAIAVALSKGGPRERETLRYVQQDPRTRPKLAAVIQELLGD